VIIRGLIAALRATGEPLLREPLFRLIRRADDRDDSHTRELMRRVYAIEIGRQTHGAFEIDGSVAPGTVIGAFCSVAAGARLGGSQHPTSFVSTHGFLYLRNRGIVAADREEIRDSLNGPVVIEDDVWIGANAVVMPGVTVRRGAVIGAGAVVTSDVEPYSVAVGVPARVIRSRIPEDQARALAEVPWTEWDDETIRERLDDFYDVGAFLKRYGPAS
jgi:acetyltransferase-like isoleucine patch superfamily enzyme